MAKKKKEIVLKEPGITDSRITAIYVRVSTDAQYEEGYSIDVQTDRLIKWCEAKGYNNYEVYEDGGYSGSNIKRPATERLLLNINRGKIERVVVYKLDRLSRSQKDTLFLLEEVFIPNDVEFCSLNENFDTGTPYGKAMIGILSVFAQLERENIRERTRMGMYERVKSGYWPGGGLVPFGYDYDPQKNILVPNKESPMVKQIYEMYIKGYSTSQLANIFPVANDRHVVNILERVTYLGKIPYNNEIYQGKHQPLITEDLWLLVQKEREKRRKIPVGSTYLLTGLLRCGKCGAKIRYQKWGDKIKLYCYSQQTSKPKLVKDPHCDNMKYNAREVEEIVLNDLFDITDSISLSKDGSEFSLEEKMNSVKTIENQRKILIGKIKNQYNLYAENPSPLLLETIQSNEEELKSLEELIENEKESAEAIRTVAEKAKVIGNLRALWDTLQIEEKKDILKTCIKEITLTGEDISIRYLI